MRLVNHAASDRKILLKFDQFQFVWLTSECGVVSKSPPAPEKSAEFDMFPAHY